MWMLDNQTPYGAERNWIRDKNGAHLWIVAVKATFDIGPGGALKLADEQKPPLLAPEYFGEPGRSSLRYDSDLLAARPGTDVVVHAHAHAPRGKLAPKVEVRMRVGEIDKEIAVFGRRAYYRGLVGLAVTSPAPFESWPIRYEWAYGGSDMEDPDQHKHRYDSRNPVGKGLAADIRKLEGQLAHRIEYPRGAPKKAGPAGFGPIDSSWSPRLERAGTYDAAWQSSRMPLLPEDYDERFALCSPADQMPAKPLRGGEMVELTNMTPDGVLRLQLPRMYLVFTTHVRTRREEHRALLAAVILEPELKKLAMVWQTSLPVKQKDSEYLDRTTIREKPYLT
jgi:hypothetical protein